MRAKLLPRKHLFYLQPHGLAQFDRMMSAINAGAPGALDAPATDADATGGPIRAGSVLSLRDNPYPPVSALQEKRPRGRPKGSKNLPKSVSPTSLTESTSAGQIIPQAITESEPCFVPDDGYLNHFKDLVKYEGFNLMLDYCI